MAGHNKNYDGLTSQLEICLACYPLNLELYSSRNFNRFLDFKNSKFVFKCVIWNNCRLIKTEYYIRHSLVWTLPCPDACSKSTFFCSFLSLRFRSSRISTQPVSWQAPSALSRPLLHLLGSGYELGCSGGTPKWSQQVFHCVWSNLALHGFCLPGDGVCGGGAARVERRAKRLCLQHSPAGLQQCVLRPCLPHLSHPSVGSAAHLHHLPISNGCRPCQVSRKKGLAVHRRPWGKTSVCTSWEETWRAVVDIPGKKLNLKINH